MDAAAALRRGLLLDTNILLLLGVGLIRAELVDRFKRTASYSRRDYNLVLRYSGRAGRLVTTPHILAEFSNLFFAGISKGSVSPANAIAAIREMTEFVIVKNDWIQSPDLARLGVTDVGIVIAARRERVLVMTDDAALYRRLESEQCAVRNINHLRSHEFLGN